MIRIAELAEKPSCCVDAALLYAELGYSVFPLSPASKCPLAGSKGWRDATRDEHAIRTAWDRHPDANLGIATAGLYAIDVDPGSPWLEDGTIERLQSTGAPAVRTPRGGWHCYFKLPADTSGKNSVGKIAKNVDVRSEGGYLVAPPSKTPTGEYVWHQRLVAVAELPDAPEWLLRNRDTSTSDNSGNAEELAEIIACGVPEGQRNDSAASVAGTFLRRVPILDDFGIHAAWLLLKDWNERNRPPLPEAELRAVLGSICQREQDRRAEAESLAQLSDSERTSRMQILRHPDLTFSLQFFDGALIAGLTARELYDPAKLLQRISEVTSPVMGQSQFEQFWRGSRPSKGNPEGAAGAYAELLSKVHDVESPVRPEAREEIEMLEWFNRLRDERVQYNPEFRAEEPWFEDLSSKPKGGIGFKFEILRRLWELTHRENFNRSRWSRLLARFGGHRRTIRIEKQPVGLYVVPQCGLDAIDRYLASVSPELEAD